MILKSRAKRQTTAGNRLAGLWKIIVFALYCFAGASEARAQEDSCNLQISLLTCGPGEDLYSVFGHTAIRVRDAAAGSDVIFNYGTFDFADPDFYVKFVKGKLIYYVSADHFTNFYKEYEYFNRSIVEQMLTLSCDEKENLYQALKVNAQEENKNYRYEFLFDNCSTRPRDMVMRNANDSISFKRIIPNPGPTFRDMIHEYLYKGGKYWSAFGIDLLLASRIDRPATNLEAMFLPDYLMKGFDSAYVKGQPLVGSKKLILPASEEEKSSFSITPMIVMITLLLVGAFLAYTKNNRWQKFANVFDIAFFLLLGIAGCLMLYMWYGTEHELCRNNYNLYWALPTHIVAAFFVGSNKAWVRKYFTISAILAAVFFAMWAFLPQGMNYAFLPVVFLSAIRSYCRAIKK